MHANRRVKDGEFLRLLQDFLRIIEKPLKNDLRIFRIQEIDHYSTLYHNLPVCLVVKVKVTGALARSRTP